MSVKDKSEKIKKKIAALLAMTKENGASEQEAFTAMSMAAKLMMEHGISEEDIRSSTPNDFVKESIDKHRKKLHEVDYYLVVGIADYCGTKVYVDRQEGGIVFFGYGVDVELAKYIRQICRFALEYEWSMYFALYNGSTHGRTLRKSFMVGMTRRLNARLKALKADNTVYSGSTALISLKNQVVDQAFRDQLKLKLKKTSHANTVKYNEAFTAGIAAGDKVNFSKPVQQGESMMKLLA